MVTWYWLLRCAVNGDDRVKISPGERPEKSACTSGTFLQGRRSLIDALRTLEDLRVARAKNQARRFRPVCTSTSCCW